MRFAVPTVDEPPAMTVAAADLYLARHIAAARLLQRSPPGTPCDPADARASAVASAACDAIPGSLVTEAHDLFRSRHRCESLLSCPLGPSPRGAR